MAEERHDVTFVVSAILGAIGGAAYGLLNAPQAGWRTRSDLSGLAEELGDRLAMRLKSTTAKVQSLAPANDPSTEETGVFYFPAERPAPVAPDPADVTAASLEGVNAQ